MQSTAIHTRATLDWMKDRTNTDQTNTGCDNSRHDPAKVHGTQVHETHMDGTEQHQDYALIAQAIEYLEQNMQSQPGLHEIAQAAGVSTGHLQRTFQRWAGISPKRFLQYLTVEHAKARLDASRSVLETAFSVGLSGPGRLHDHFVRVEAMTPGEYKRRAAGLSITYGSHATPFGPALVAVTSRGLNAVAFIGAEGYGVEVERLAQHWPGAQLVEDATATAGWAARIFDPKPRAASARKTDRMGDNVLEEDTPEDGVLPVLLKGTAFQIKVWEALLRVPEGALCTYGDIARRVCGPKAARAVGAAVGANPIAYLIPCHRVIRQTGVIHDYRWGSTRKKALLGWEAAKAGRA